MRQDKNIILIWHINRQDTTLRATIQRADHYTCGSLCVARVEKLPVVLEFTSFQDTIMFHKRGRFGLEKVQNNEINVKVVLDMECGNI